MLILKTDNGPHPPETWADATARMIFPIADVAPERIAQARKIQTAIMEELVGHHSARQSAERGNLGTKGDAHLATGNDATAEATAAFAAITQIVKGSPWEAHFATDAVRDAAIGEIAAHMQTINHIERSWHCNRNQKSVKAQAWLKMHNPGAPNA